MLAAIFIVRGGYKNKKTQVIGSFVCITEKAD
jgi:hypothetical protein